MKESVESFKIFERSEQGEELSNQSEERMVLNYTKIGLNIT